MSVTTRRTLMVGSVVSFGFMTALGAQAQGNGVWVITGGDDDPGRLSAGEPPTG